MKKKIELGNFGTRSVCFLSYRDQEHDKNMDTTKSDTNADVKGLYDIYLRAHDECCLSEKAREVMELVETARIWYIDSGANIQFQLFGPMLGAAILAVCKEFMKKVIPFPNFLISVGFMLWQQLPAILSGIASGMASVGAAGLY